MAFSKNFLLVALAFAVLLISAEVSAHRDLAEATTTTQKANTDGYGHGGHGGGGYGHGGGGYGHGGGGYGHGGGGYGHGGHGGGGGHGPHAVETETKN
ncbi:cold and drought-regulated protein CORA-like [Rosa rugosa]|uniref:cold and drought-regulated protein CORA-like n=1 Tax=Rosa rugosa TaxID=74645 RepID=UPI002B413112|nr:cold and drought-regulated protein CORA-like [Rosa rugosa]